jgi:23S rRNA pseudouridine2605 synthase
MRERLQKLLSQAGLCSRRQAEVWIQQGRVTVNGAPAQLGDRADPDTDEILVDGAALSRRERRVCLLLNKPRGYVTTLSDEQGRKTVAELVADCGVRVYPVGRLDLNSEGLLLMTNDGDLAQHLTHPSHQVEKEYLVRVTGDADSALPRLRRDMTVDGERFRGAKVRVLSQEGDSSLLSVTIAQGRNRQVRRMCAACGLTVHRLRRIREGSLALGSLKSGQWRRLSEKEIGDLLQS